MGKITYATKDKNATDAALRQFRDADANEIKRVVNGLDDETVALRALIEELGGDDDIVATMDAAVGHSSWRQPRVYTASIAGAVTLDLSQGDVFQLTLTGHVTSFDFTNEVPGKSYVFYFMQDTTRKNLQWATGRYRFSFGNAPQLTDPTQNGSDPVAAVDIITALCPFAGRLDLVSSPNYVAN